MTAFAIYRMPHADHCVRVEQTSGKAEEMRSLACLNGRTGFVVAPFTPSADCPILLIRPDRVSTFHIDNMQDAGSGNGWSNDDCEQDSDDDSEQGLCDNAATGCVETRLRGGDRATYAADFARFHARIADGHFQKIVLARCATLDASAKPDALALFERACRMYPRMFVALVATDQGGTWLTATPEVLLKGDGARWSTMALAGTMRLSGDQLAFDNPPSATAKATSDGIEWSEKNIREQRYVASYIEQCIAPLADNVAERGPYTVRAGKLVHRRSDFSFTLNADCGVGDLTAALHPTPAVCGLPKEEAWQFIQDNETTPRRYYSGFAGPLGIGGLTNLCVSLRCMEILRSGFRLYAGGGLIDDSSEEAEWNETEAKMETMRSVIGHREFQNITEDTCIQTKRT